MEVRNIDINFSSDENIEEDRKLKGYAILYNSLSEPLYNDSFREIIKKGAFSRSLKEDEQVCLWGHDSRYVVGRKSTNTLSLIEDDRGLYFEVSPPNTTWANDLIESVHRRDISKMSFGFKVIRDNWKTDKETIDKYNLAIREVEEIKLLEISLVAFPAYTDTSVRSVPKVPVSYDFFYFREHFERKIRILKLK